MNDKDLFFEAQYKKALAKLVRAGVEEPNRTGTSALTQEEPAFFAIDLAIEGVPALRGKKVFPEKALAEAFWIMLGRNNVKYLHAHNVHYWDKFADWSGSIGPGYGTRIRNLSGTDQLERAAKLLIEQPQTRQNVISFWNPNSDRNVVPCYLSFQFTVIGGDKVNMHVTQRSGDAFLGVPTDAMVFAFMLGALATYAELKPGKIFYTINNFHLYTNHLVQAKKYLRESVRWYSKHKPLPVTPNVSMISWFKGESARIHNFLVTCANLGIHNLYDFSRYESGDFIKAPIAI